MARFWDSTLLERANTVSTVASAAQYAKPPFISMLSQSLSGLDIPTAVSNSARTSFPWKPTDPESPPPKFSVRLSSSRPSISYTNLFKVSTKQAGKALSPRVHCWFTWSSYWNHSQDSYHFPLYFLPSDSKAFLSRHSTSLEHWRNKLPYQHKPSPFKKHRSKLSQ